MNKGDQVRVAVIGLGFGVNHARTAMLVREARLVAGCDLMEERGSPAKEWGVPFYTDFRQMLDEVEIDAVVAAISNDQHEAVAVECLQRRVPILLEKPIATTLDEADRIIAAGRESGTPLLIGHHRRFSAFVLKAREVVQGGEIGELVGASVLWTMLKPRDYYDAEWRTRRAMGGGPLLINTIHDIDDLRFITGREFVRLQAELSHRVRGLEVEDTISLSLRMGGDVLVTIFTADCVPAIWAYESTTSPWENPYFFYTPGDCYYFFGTQGSLTLPQLQRVYYADQTRQGWQWPLTVERLGVQPVHPLHEEMRHFCAVVRSEAEPRTSGEDARRTLEVVLGIMQAGKTGQPVAFT
jgi:predicted dehydrogenase